MIIAIACAALLKAEDPMVVLQTIQKRYQALKSFSMKIEHHNSSGLFPGNYKQSLSWQAPKRFELKVTKATDYKPTPGNPGGIAPNYFCNGVTVHLASETSTRPDEPLNTDPNIVPGWEVSGGQILGWLMKTPASTFFFNAPKGFKLAYSFGPATKWQSMDVREIDVKVTMEQSKQSVDSQIFISPQSDRVLGFAFSVEGYSGWAKYTDQVDNPKFPHPIGG